MIAFLYEFGYEKQADRATRNAQLLAQIADLSYEGDNKIEATSPAIKNIMELLAQEDIPMDGVSAPGARLAGANLEGALNLTQSMLASAEPSPSPVSLPEGLDWPFEQDENGDWVRKQ